jgi:glycosyltransferase involved in cell wall biosynthesis
MAPVISVITTVYNKEETISACVDSILNQDYADFEMIIVDDGSTDTSRAKIAAFLRDTRIRTFQINHIGHSGAKNKGAENALGKIDRKSVV